MRKIDKQKSLLNVFVSMFFKLILLFGNFFVRRYLIKFAGNDINGINSLYISIIGMLSVVELGIGEAIIFCMYKPIVEGDRARVSALYNLFKRIYFVIGLAIAVAGCLIMPFLPYLAKGYSNLDINLYLTFVPMLVSTVLTYFFSAKISLMNAYRDNYIATTINSGVQLLQLGLQIIVLFVTKSYLYYLICRVIAVLVQWCATNIIMKRKYNPVLDSISLPIDKETKKEIIKNVKALFAHRIGAILVNTIDSLIISIFVGITVLGKYSNYTVVATAIIGVITLFFTPLISTIGHLFVKDKAAVKRYYNFFCALNFAIGCIFFLGYYSIINNLITLIFGTGLILHKSVPFVITMNYFIQFMRQSTLLFRDASGTFYYDRWKPLAEGISNLVLSIVFVHAFQKVVGDDFAVAGVIIATIITNIFICHTVEPYVLHKHAFHISVKKHYLRNYLYIISFVVLLSILDFCMITNNNIFIEILINGCISVGISTVPIMMLVLFNKDFAHYIKIFAKKIYIFS